MTTASHSWSLADALYGPVQLPAHADQHGRAPGGYRSDTRGEVQTPAEAVVRAKGPGALLGPSSPLFGLIVLVLAFIVVNAWARD